MSILDRLRLHAISHSLFPPTTLKAAIRRLGFVQADPIRSPARAQDLILRHRVTAYKAGDLERRYASLGIEEDYLYAYGFLPRDVWQLIHPRNPKGMSAFEKKVLDVVSNNDAVHPRDLENYFAKKRVINAWGGYSKATTQALDDLHYRGLVRVVRREKNIRIWEAVRPATDPPPAAERLRKLIRVFANILAPVAQQTLQANIGRCAHLGNPREALRGLLQSGELAAEKVDGLTYVWLAEKAPQDVEAEGVRFLAPFDPLVWDRRRFEHFWKWSYRFEAYTPVAKRVRGYYAMPLLWRDRVIGWVNARMNGERVEVETGFVEERPKEKAFRSALDAEISRMESFLDGKARGIPGTHPEF